MSSNPGQDPLLIDPALGPSPEQQKRLEDDLNRGVGDRLARARQYGPTIRQRTQSEAIDIELVLNQIGRDPFSTRYVPFSILREMTADLMIGYSYQQILTPLVRANWHLACPDAQVAGAVDEALRPIITETIVSFCNSLLYAYQPLVKRFSLGKLTSTYRDPNADDPDIDRSVWTSSAQPIVWDAPQALNPSHCLPQWDDSGQLNGFTFSSVPIPTSALIGAATLYGWETIPGYQIPADFAMWIVNESEQNFGSIFGSPRTKRAYRYWWSYWFRWALADRSFENKADPPKVVYYPTDFDQFIDPEDPNASNPQVHHRRNEAISLGEQSRSGATLALPGDFMESDGTGKQSTVRKWMISYLEHGHNFSDLDATFAYLDKAKFRAMFVPEQAYLDAGGSASAARYVAPQLGEVYEESEQVLADLFDRYINRHMIPQFIAANFPEKAGIPCQKITHGIGGEDMDLVKQIITLVGQVRGNVFPVDIREILRQKGIPLLTNKQFEKELEQIRQMASAAGPAAREPERVGSQGYNAGVGKSMQTGEPQYFNGPQRIVLAESDGFLSSLPDTPHYRDAAVRSAILRLRKLMLDRYRERYESIASFVSDQAVLKLAQPQNGQPPTQQGNSHPAAVAAAAALISAWAATQVQGSHDSGTSSQLAELVGKIALDGGRSALRGARLAADTFDSQSVDPWVRSRVAFALDSIDSTVRDEAQAFLIDALQRASDPQVVAMLFREHFSDFPMTHADRAVRAEAREAYNRGVLLAAQEAGVAQVQAHDASDGRNPLSDAKCVQRNGKVMSVQDALKETEHVHGTLYWTLLPTERLSLEVVPSLPEHLSQDGLQAAYDAQRETLYVLEAVPDELRRGYLLAVGESLAL